MSSFGIFARIDDKRVLDAMRNTPRVMLKHLERGLDRAAHEVAREERRVTPKAFSTLTNSVQVLRTGRLERVIAPGVDYAPMVEEGTGPGGNPPQQTLVDWIRAKRIEPRDPTMDVEDLAFVIGRSIREKGTRPQPFAQPTHEKMQGRVVELVRQSAMDGLREVGLQ
ncbi:MAG: hypothetical protein AB1450_08350 [Pseudomonadota bacterium]